MESHFKNKGIALAGVLIFLLLVMIICVGVTRQIRTNLDVEENLQSQNSYYDGSIRCLSWGLTLSETNIPYKGAAGTIKPYWVSVGSDSQQKYVIEYKRMSPVGQYKFISHFPFFEWVDLYNYEVTARPFVEAQDSAVVSAPPRF